MMSVRLFDLRGLFKIKFDCFDKTKGTFLRLRSGNFLSSRNIKFFNFKDHIFRSLTLFQRLAKTFSISVAFS